MKRLILVAALSANASAQTELQVLEDSSGYINHQVSHAIASVQEMTSAAANGQIVAAGTSQDSQIEYTYVAAYNQALVDVEQASYYSATDYYEDQFEDSMGQLEATVEVFAEAATEISKVEAVHEQVSEADTPEAQVDLQNYIRANDVQIDEQDVAVFNHSLEKIEETAQAAAVYKNAAHDEAVLAETNFIAEVTLSNLTRTTSNYDAYKDTLNIYFDTPNTLSFEGYFMEVYGADQLLGDAGVEVLQ